MEKQLMIDVICIIDPRSFRPGSSKLIQITLVVVSQLVHQIIYFLKRFLRKTGVDQWTDCLEPILL